MTFVLKMFIGGLSWNTNDSMLYHHFSKFGEVVEHCVMRDAATQRSRGFGFVKFADADAVERVSKDPASRLSYCGLLLMQIGVHFISELFIKP